MSDDGNYAVFSFDDNTLQMINVLTNEIVSNFDSGGHLGSVSAISISNDLKYVITGGYDNLIIVWQMDAIIWNKDHLHTHKNNDK